MGKEIFSVESEVRKRIENFVANKRRVHSLKENM